MKRFVNNLKTSLTKNLRLEFIIPLQSWVSTDTKPVSYTALLDWHRSVRRVFADRMRHTVFDLLRIVTDGQSVVVEQREWTLLDCGRAIPTEDQNGLN